MDDLIKKSDLSQVNKNGYSLGMIALRYNNEKNLNLTIEQIDYLIKNSDLSQVNKSGQNLGMQALCYNRSQKLNLNIKQIDYLIKNSDLSQVDANGQSLGLIALSQNNEQSLNLTIEQIDCLIKKSDLSKVNENGRNLGMIALRNNNEQKLNLTIEQIDYLIKNSDLSKVDVEGWSLGMIALRYNNEQKLNLTHEQIDYLIKTTPADSLLNSRLVDYGHNLLLLFLSTQAENKFSIKTETLEYLIDNSNLNWATSDGNNWTMLYLENKGFNIPKSPKILSKLFESIVESPELIIYSLNSFLQNNKSHRYNLEGQQLDFLINKLSNADNDLLLTYFNNKTSQNINISKESVTKLVSTMNVGNEDSLNSFLQNNKSHGYNLESQQLDFLINKLSNNNNDLLLTYFNNKTSQNINISEESVTKLISTMTVGKGGTLKELLKCLSEPGRNIFSEKQWKSIFVKNKDYLLVSSGEIEKLIYKIYPAKSIDMFKTLLDETSSDTIANNIQNFINKNIFAILIDKVEGTKKIDLTSFSSVAQKFTEILADAVGHLSLSDLKQIQDNISVKNIEKFGTLIKQLVPEINIDLISTSTAAGKQGNKEKSLSSKIRKQRGKMDEDNADLKTRAGGHVVA